MSGFSMFWGVKSSRITEKNIFHDEIPIEGTLSLRRSRIGPMTSEKINEQIRDTRMTLFADLIGILRSEISRIGWCAPAYSFVESCWTDEL